MNKIKNYVKEHGVGNIVKKLYYRVGVVIGFKKSKTCFFVKNVEKTNYKDSRDYTITLLNKDSKKEFDKIKYFDFINSENLLSNENFEVILLKDKTKLIAYLVLDFGNVHKIHSLGFWKLSSQEVWLGPTYVIKEYRGNGINSILLKHASSFCSDKGINRIFTCINKNNISSIKSFQKNGFVKCGEVIKRLNTFKGDFKIPFKDKFQAL